MRNAAQSTGMTRPTAKGAARWRGVTALVAALVLSSAGALAVVFGFEVWLIETRAVLNFSITVAAMFLPLAALTEYGQRSSWLGRWLEYLQAAFMALVLHKYVWVAAMIAPFSLRGLDLYVWVFGLFSVLGLGIAKIRESDEKRIEVGPLRRWGIGAISILLLLVVVALVIHRARPFIPSLRNPPIGVNDPMVDRSAEFGFEILSPTLQIDNPIYLFESPNSKYEFCVLSRSGQVYAVSRDGESWTSELIMTIADRFDSLESELGAAAAVFGKVERESNGLERSRLFLFYVNGSIDEACTNVVSFEFEVEGFELVEGSETQLIRQYSTSGEHNGGGMVFGSDGYLYLSFGDGSAGYDIDETSQNLSKSLLSGIIRIDVYGEDLTKVKSIKRQPERGETGGYWIPKGNPFVGQENVLEEFWALGLRNPFRMSFLPDGERLIVGEVGQASYDEINIMAAGSNAQWSFREGPLKFRHSTLKGTTPHGFGDGIRPFYWNRVVAERGAVIGGLVLQKSVYATENGKYVFSDFRSGEILSLDLETNDDRPVPELLVSKNSPGFGPAYLATSLFLYRGQLLVTRLGRGDDGSTLLRMRQSDEFSAESGAKRKRSGGDIFLTHCASCHGSADDPAMAGVEGARNFGDVDWQRSVSDSLIRDVIRNGVRNEENDIAMPAWGGILSDPEIESLIEVIRAYED